MFRVMRTGQGARKSVGKAVIQIDRARGCVRDDDPEEALEVWKGSRGGAQLDGRLVRSSRATLLGDSNKLISSCLRISQPRVSSELRSAMRKLGVLTRAQLVERLRGFQSVA